MLQCVCTSLMLHLHVSDRRNKCLLYYYTSFQTISPPARVQPAKYPSSHDHDLVEHDPNAKETLFERNHLPGLLNPFTQRNKTIGASRVSPVRVSW